MAKRKTKKELEAERIQAKADSFEYMSELILDILNLYVTEDGTVISTITEEPEKFEEKVLKHHTRYHIANIRRNMETELDLLTGNTKIAQYYFEKFLHSMELDYTGYGIEIEEGSRLREIPDTYAWTVCITCVEHPEMGYELKSKYYKNRNLGLIELILLLSNYDMNIKHLNIIDM